MSCTRRDEGHAPAVITRIVSVAALFCLGCSGNLTAATLTPLNGVYGLVSQSPERRWGAVVLIEIDSPGAISEVRISDFELFDDNDTVTRASSVVSVDEILRFRDGWERECGDWRSAPGDVQPWSGDVRAGKTHVLVRIELESRPPPPQGGLKYRLRLGEFKLEAEMRCGRWAN